MIDRLLLIILCGVIPYYNLKSLNPMIKSHIGREYDSGIILRLYLLNYLFAFPVFCRRAVKVYRRIRGKIGVQRHAIQRRRQRVYLSHKIKHGVKISPDAKEAIISAVGENSARGYIAMMSNNSALGIDSVYDELSVALPGYFTSDALTESEKMRRVIDVYTWLKDGKSMQDVKLIDVMTPDDALTEAECAALISRVLNIDVGTEGEHWYDSAISALKKLGISDNETDNPESAIPRENVCAMAVRAYEYKKGAAPTKAVEYTDKDSISGDKLVFAEKALWLNLMSGDTMNSFMPKNSITRAEAAKVIQRLSYILS